MRIIEPDSAIQSPFDHNQLGPFLRWTGSKRWLAQTSLDEILPKKFNSYHEPFLGGGAVFFHIIGKENNRKRKFYLSDVNEELINCYKQLKVDFKGVLKHLRGFENNEIAYYKVRDISYNSDLKRAARFIYLNRTSFNGIYRVNSSGKYNVPYGYRSNVDLVTSDLLKNVSIALSNARLSCNSFEKSIQFIKEGDLVFIDPPYTVAHENNGFIEYNQKLFSWKDQIKLEKYILKIKERGGYFIMANASHKSIIDLYKHTGEIIKLSRYSKVGGRNKTRGEFNELIFCNTL